MVNHFEPLLKLVYSAVKNQEFIGAFGVTHQEMINEKVEGMRGILGMMTELKLASMKRRVKMLKN